LREDQNCLKPSQNNDFVVLAGKFADAGYFKPYFKFCLKVINPPQSKTEVCSSSKLVQMNVTQTTSPMTSSAQHPDTYALFTTASTRIMDFCREIEMSDGIVDATAVKRTDSFIRLFRSRMSAQEQGSVFMKLYQSLYPILAQNTSPDQCLMWLRGQPHEMTTTGTRSQCSLEIGNTYIDIGLVYSYVADRANRASKLMAEIGGHTETLAEHTQAPLVFALQLYTIFGCLFGDSGEHRHIAERRAFLQDALGQMGVRDDADGNETISNFINPFVNMLDGVLATNVEGNPNVAPEISRASATFRQNLNANRDGDPVTRLMAAVQNTMNSDGGKNLMGSLTGMLGSEYPGVKRFMENLHSVQSGQDVADAITRATSDPQMLDELQRKASSTIGMMMSGSGAPKVSAEQTAATEAAMHAQGSLDFPVFSSNVS
jgi:hypothetical protein